ncbi:MAG: HDOD domain-containing protein [Pseudomonadota bacterium]
MPEKTLIELLEETLEAGAIKLPVFSQVALELQEVIRKDNFSMTQLSEIIEEDQALTAQVLKSANTAFYSGLQPAKTIRDAVVRLGANSIVNLTIMVTQKQAYKSKTKELSELTKLLWSHALGAATGSRWLAQRLGRRQIAEIAFLAGLLHDVGKLLLLKAVEDLKSSGRCPYEITITFLQEIFETIHAPRGEKFLRRQNLPEDYCLIAGRHHDPPASPGNDLLNLVRLANLTCHKLGIGPKHQPDLTLSVTTEAKILKADDLLLAELQVGLEEQVASLQMFL